jgi:hypothetical protein
LRRYTVKDSTGEGAPFLDAGERFTALSVGAAGRARISYAIGMAKPICGGCRERDARIAARERRVADPEARLLLAPST